MEQEEMKYRKRAKPKPVQKSNHKHNYTEPVIYVVPFHSFDMFWIKHRCPICGKLATIQPDWLHHAIDENGHTYYRSVSSLEEAKRLCPDYPIIYGRKL